MSTVQRIKKVIPYLILALLCGVAFYLRVMGQLDKVFVKEGTVWFRATDSWYHLRLLESMLKNFPYFLTWDPYAMWPIGAPSGYHPLMEWVVYLVYKLGIDYKMAAAYLPPVAGTLTLIPIFMIGKYLWGWKQGLVAGLLVAILPTETYFRTQLGSFDHHALEILLMPFIIYFLLKRNTWGTGVSLGLYLLNWHGGAFIGAIFGFWYWYEFLFLMHKNESSWELSKFISLSALLGLIISLPVTLLSITRKETLFLMGGIIFAPAILELGKKIARSKEMFLFVLTVLLPIGTIALDLVWPLQKIAGSTFWGWGSYIEETSPLTIGPFFSMYGITIFTSLGGLLLFIKENRYKLLIVWTILMMVFTIGEIRWTYYLTLCFALLTAYFAFSVPKYVSKDTRVYIPVLVLVFTIMSFIKGVPLAYNAPMYITQDWYNSMTWLRTQTPNPFKDENTYYKLETKEVPQYSVLSWWDYGHFIIQIGQRVPFDSPTHPSDIPAYFLMAQTVEDANKVIENKDVKYIVFDKSVIEGKWYAVALRGGDITYTKAWELRDTSMAMRLWENRAEGYKIVYQEGNVKIWERE